MNVENVQEDQIAEDDGFTKEQQDTYFDDGCCPYCGSKELLLATQKIGENDPTKMREVFCDDCEEEWVEARYCVGGSSYLLKSSEVEEVLGEEDECEDDLEDEDDLEIGTACKKATNGLNKERDQ